MNKILLFAFLIMYSFFSAQLIKRSLSTEEWQFKNSKEQKWLPAKIPGTIHLDLMNNNIIPDPFKDENEKKVQWVENENWDYQTSFNISSKEWDHQNIDLVFHGLDTFAEIYLNGERLQKTDNMFRTWTFPVKSYLKSGNNLLQVKFKSAVVTGKELAEKVAFTTPESPRTFVRKAQYQFGWDWGPRLVTAGIWKEVELNFWNEAKLQNVKIEQKRLTQQNAELTIHAEILADKEGKYSVWINNEKKEIQLKKGNNKIQVPFVIWNPRLWQPNGWGEPYLYTFKIVLTKDLKELSEEELRIGLKTVELIQEKDTHGKPFYFKVNGHPLYVKGTNWIPADSFSPRVTKEKYQQLIKVSKEAHMNMIRVWGGGIYEDDEFYKACDENGILVWQDFMFAGSFYPADEVFLNNVKEEIKDQVNRLQNHASIALWCGNNEIDEAIVNWGYQKQFKYSKEDSLQVWKDYKKLFHEIIPNTLRENLVSDKNIYWPSSPSIGWGHPESLTEGDSHYWGVWWGEQPFEVYNEKVGRFMSEYGFQGMPTLETLRSMFLMMKPDFSLRNPVIKNHEKHTRGWEIIETYMKRDYNVPDYFVDYQYVSQLLQARGIKMAIEAHRRAKPYNMGTLYWQLNDCWPAVSWSSIDYLGNWKALHYQVKRSFAPQIILTEEKENTLHFYAVNDDLKEYENVHLEVEVIKFDGKVLNKLDLKSSEKIFKGIIKFEPIKSAFHSLRNETFLKLILKDQSDNIIAQNNYFFSQPKDLKLAQPHIQITKIAPDEIEISTDVLAKDLYLMSNTSENTIKETHFSDNFFDLLPNEKKRIKLSKPLEKVKVMSLWDVMRY